MNDSNPLHWSFNYNQGAQNPDFAHELIKSIETYTTNYKTKNNDDEVHFKKHVYQILPNFWRGYRGRNDQNDSLHIGWVTIERQKDINIWNYSIRYQNHTSGEDIHSLFNCKNECYRSLQDNWRVNVQNNSSDAYSQLKIEGYFTTDKEIKLNIQGVIVPLILPVNSLPITCNWTLYDVIPALSDKLKSNDDSVKIVLLEDLEQLRPNSKIGFLDSIHSPIPLDGYYLCGTGFLPSYWWVDQYGNVVIVSTVFETFVLREVTETT